MHKRMMVILVSVLLAGASQVCRASSITLISSSAGVYDYGLTLNAGESVVFNPNQTITLSGLSGVTGASVSGFLDSGGFAVSSFSSTSVVYSETLELVPTAFGNAGSTPVTYGTFVVDSTALTPGPIGFSMETSAGTVTGTVAGPAAVTPEPGSLALFALALVIFLPGALWVEQRRRRATA